MSLSVMKLVGTGNDFLFIDGRSPLPAGVSRDSVARQLCDRHFGIGADGLVFVETRDGLYEWDFYNTDGSHAEMCGNATRCLGRWASLKLGAKQIDFKTAAGSVHVEVDGAIVKSYLDFVTAHPILKQLRVAGRDVSVYWLDTGVPHFVAKVASVTEAMKDLEVIRALRFHTEGGPRGANVTFLEILTPTSFKTVTYERGVEDFTLSCGTGVIAAAAVGLHHMKNETGSALTTAHVETPGGRLQVEFKPAFKGVTLTGPALRVFETEINEETLRSS
jgi:diaminopimelate epimerase